MIAWLVLFSASATLPTSAGAEAAALEAESEVPTVLISTDIATGLVDTHGAQGLCPVTYSTSKLATMHDADFSLRTSTTV